MGEPTTPRNNYVTENLLNKYSWADHPNYSQFIGKLLARKNTGTNIPKITWSRNACEKSPSKLLAVSKIADFKCVLFEGLYFRFYFVEFCFRIRIVETVRSILHCNTPHPEGSADREKYREIYWGTHSYKTEHILKTTSSVRWLFVVGHTSYLQCRVS